MSSPPQAQTIPAGKGWLRRRFGGSGLALLLLLAVVTGVCLQHAIDGPTPWDEKITRRVAEGKELRAKEHGIIGLWWGSVVSAGLGALLLLGAPLWMPGGPNKPRRPGTHGGQFNWNFHLALLIILGGGLLLRAPLLSHSLWNDEEYSMRRYVHGHQEAQPDGSLEFKKVPWTDTLFLNANGNNHLLFSAAARLSLETWRLFTETSSEVFSEVVLRMPSFVAGVFTLAVLGLLGAEMRLPSVGLGAAALLALHPWHVRYAVEAKGYSLMLFFITVAMLALLYALRRDKVAAWLTFALAQSGFMLCFAGSLYVAVALNLLAAWEILRRREPARLRVLAGFNLVTLIPLLLWKLASVPQILEFLRRESVLQTPIGAAWARDIGSHLAAGILYVNPQPELHLGTSWLEQAQAPLWSPLLGHALPFLALVGVFMALLSPPAARLAVLTPVLGAALVIAQNFAVGQSLLSWYLLYLLPALCLAVPVACHTLLPWSDKTAPAAILLIVALFGMSTEDARQRYIQHDRQPIRQAAHSYREPHPEAIRVTFGVSDRQLHSYDPLAVVITTSAELDSHMARAREERRPLFAVICGAQESTARHPELARQVRESGAFRLHGHFPGLEAMFSYEVWRLAQ